MKMSSLYFILGFMCVLASQWHTELKTNLLTAAMFLTLMSELSEIKEKLK